MYDTQTRADSNRQNAQNSTGPKTETGKQRSSQNALRHGLSGRVVVLPTEDLAAYRQFSKELVDSLKPETPFEIQLAQTIADAQWRLNRARTIEDGMLAWGNFEPEGNFNADRPEIHAALTAAKVFRDRHQAFANLALYEQRIQRAQREALRQLRESQALRKVEEKSEEKETFQPAKKPMAKAAGGAQENSGFVCSTTFPTAPVTPKSTQPTPPPAPQTHPFILDCI